MDLQSVEVGCTEAPADSARSQAMTATGHRCAKIRPHLCARGTAFDGEPAPRRCRLPQAAPSSGAIARAWEPPPRKSPVRKTRPCNGLSRGFIDSWRGLAAPRAIPYPSRYREGGVQAPNAERPPAGVLADGECYSVVSWNVSRRKRSTRRDFKAASGASSASLLWEGV